MKLLIETVLAVDGGANAPAVQDIVQVASLRQQMDRQCKQRRFREPSPTVSHEFSEYPRSQTQSHTYNLTSGFDMESQPSNYSNTSNEYESALSAAMPAFPGPRSVFEEAYMTRSKQPLSQP